MTNASIAATLFLALAATGASAAPRDEENLPGPYLGAAVGASHYKFHFDCRADATKCDKTPYGFKVFGGLPMSKHLALELQYIQYGEAEAKVGSATLTGEGRHFGVGLALSNNYGDRWSSIARAGLASNKFKATGGFVGGGSDTVSENKVSYYIGASLGYRVTDNFTVEAGVDMTRFEFFGDHALARMISVGVRNAF